MENLERLPCYQRLRNGLAILEIDYELKDLSRFDSLRQ